MATGKHGSSELVITYEDAPSGTARTITPYVTSIGGIKVEALTQMTMPFGATSEVNTPTGVTKTPDIAISGWYDDTALVGPHVVFQIAAADYAPQSTGRELVITLGNSKTFTIHTHLVSYEVQPKNGALTEYTAVVRQMAAGVWA